MTEEKIDRFMNEFDFLSNFYEIDVDYEGIVWRTSEHAYQAMKTLNPEQRLNMTEIYMPGDAKAYGRAIKMRIDWNDVKLGIMEDIVRCKFQQNPELQERLKLTEDLPIEEGNTWKDTYWGICAFTGVGENHLGKILMKIRKELQ